MNFYSRHIGDRLTATAHLTWLEDCALSRLTDLYLKQEHAIVADVAKVARLVRATAADEVAAVETVLKEFFVLADHGWVSDECEAKIASAKEAQQRARDNGRKGGRPPSQKPGVSPVASQQVPSGNPEETQPVSRGNPEKSESQAPITQYPVPKYQEPFPNNAAPCGNTVGDDEGNTAASTAATKRGTRLPVDWVLQKAWGDWALDEFPSWTADTVRAEAAKFKDHWHAKAGKDATKADWAATWRNWCRNARIAPAARPGVMTDEQRAAKNAEETAKAKVLYAQRYGGASAATNDPNVIDAEATVIADQPFLEGNTQ